MDLRERDTHDVKSIQHILLLCKYSNIFILIARGSVYIHIVIIESSFLFLETFQTNLTQQHRQHDEKSTTTKHKKNFQQKQMKS